jgi:hypothetical protein
MVIFVLILSDNTYGTEKHCVSEVRTSVIACKSKNKENYHSHTSMVTATWVVTTGNWDVASNWSTGVVPDATTDVVINGLARSVTIPAGITANAQSITVDFSASLTIASTATLMISNSVLDALTITMGASVTNSGNITIGSGGSVGRHGMSISLSGSLVNQASGTININNITSYAIGMDFDTQVNNSGIINIGSTGPVSVAGFDVNNNSQIINQSTGTIQVNNITGGEGFYMQLSTLINNGTIHIGNLSAVLTRGISLQLNSQFSNAFGATTTINNITNATSTQGVGLYINSNSSCTNSGTLHIGNTTAVKNSGIALYFDGFLSNGTTGVISINNITNQDAISLTDEFTQGINSGTIHIGNLSPIKRMGIFVTSLASFSNNIGATINIDNVNGLSASQGVGIYLSAPFTNSGTINIGSNAALSQYGIFLLASGNLSNQTNGIININNISNFDGISMTGSGSMATNNGTINIGNLLAVKAYGISLFSSANFTNNTNATITINNINSTTDGYGILINGSTFVNRNMINIGNSSPIFNMGIVIANGSLTNHNTGILQINNISTLDGIQLNGSMASFTNNGMVKIGNINQVRRIGISLFNSSNFNNSTGTVEINTITSTSLGYGIYLASGSSLSNSATLTIGNIANIALFGIYVVSPATFTNQTTGIVNIGRITSNDGIIMENGSAIFNNSGQVNIGALGVVNRIGVYALNGGKFNNVTSGSILQINNIPVADGISISGTGSGVTNNGTIQIGNNAGIYRFGILVNGSTAALTNNSSGTITINNILSTAANEGTALRISGGTLTNNNILRIGNTGNISRFGIVSSSSATITNNATGSVQINRVTNFTGISQQSSAKTFNNGIINIGDIAPVNSTGIGLTTASEFYNNAGATLSINRITLFDGVDIGDASTRMLNQGTINIGNTNPIGEDGFYIYSGGLFQNEPTGVVNLSNITLSAIRLNNTNSLFTNKGAVNMTP